MLGASTSFTVVRALIAVPPMPAPKTPMASPRRSGGNQALSPAPSRRTAPRSASRPSLSPARCTAVPARLRENNRVRSAVLAPYGCWAGRPYPLTTTAGTMNRCSRTTPFAHSTGTSA